jgi:fringe
MYVIRTSSHFYRKRFIYLLQTWISLVSDNAFFVTDRVLSNVTLDHTSLTELTCGPDVHSMNTLCCKTAHDFLLFHHHRRTYDWFCHFDDDQYVHTDNLRQYLSTLDSHRSYYIGRNSWSKPLKRTKEPYPQAFWFATLGAGICLSGDLVDRLEPYRRMSTRELSRRYLSRFSHRSLCQCYVNTRHSFSFSSRR